MTFIQQLTQKNDCEGLSNTGTLVNLGLYFGDSIMPCLSGGTTRLAWKNMIYHSLSECIVIPMIDRDNRLSYCDIMSDNSHVGVLLYLPRLGDWCLRMNHNVHATQEFIDKIYSTLRKEMGKLPPDVHLVTEYPGL